MNPRFDILETSLPGLLVIQRKPIGDDRGYLERMYCQEELQSVAPGKTIAQINHTLTAKRGTVRGMHFQRPPHGETKLVSCLRGKVFDVAVDLRRSSPTFLRWHAEILTGDNHKSLAIPEGFAHGFQTLDDHCEMLYFHTTAYHPEAEDGINAGDPLLAIRWPEAISDRSARDAALPMINQNHIGIEL
jgi:dTDP-4-dehydrorhamnose 3,5-epimerase